MNTQLLYIAAAAGALFFLLRRPAAASSPTFFLPTSTGGVPNDAKDYNPGAMKNGVTTAMSVFQAVISAGAGVGAGNGKVNGCGPKPKVPSNYLTLPTSHPARVARQKWEACMGHKYDKYGKKIA